MPPLNTSTSLVDYLKGSNQASDFGSRAKLAQQYGIQNYQGTAGQNTQLLGYLNKAPNMSTNQGPRYAPPPFLGRRASAPSQNLATPTPPKLPPAQVTQETPGAPQSTANGTQSPTYVSPGTGPNPPVAAPTGYGPGIDPNTGQWSPNAPQYSPIGMNAQGQYANQGAPVPPQQSLNTQQGLNPQQQFAPNNGLYGQLIAALANANPQNNQAYLNAQQNLSNIQNQQMQANKVIGARPEDLSLATGEQGLTNALFANRENQAQGLINQALQTQKLQQAALQGAIQGATPQAIGYNQQIFNPATGQFQSGSGSSLNDAISNVIQRLQNGTMTYNDAVSALSGYGQGGVNALQQALPSGFNIAQSNTLGGVQGSVGPAVQYANTALDALSTAMSQQTVPGQGSNIPLINQAGNIFSAATGIGGQQTQAVKSAVAEARAALTNAFIQKGVTPTAAGDQANALLPDNPTPQQIAAAKQTMATLGQATKQIFGNPGQANASTNTSSNSIFNW